MFPKRKMYIGLFGIMVAWLIYMIVNKDWFVREHLTSTPTLESISKQLADTNEKIDTLSSHMKSVNDQVSAQSQQAAAAKASLDAISTGYNNILPTH